ncbi:thiolase family protein [Tepidibacter aestuarii]|uniref:thiolase family protein n=1 Tax=Tepidibacter aestuarii TaxID=2925782 RepID=UPI0020C09E93|nr:thiolase family protein [Tepidibacter aestuarii]CAH2214360.1 Acetyl-CoA acetyltransferase [Tepidibacter aestuarii]
MVYIIGGLRSPIGKTNGAFKNILPEDIVAQLLNNILKKYNLQKESIHELILGNCVGPGGNIARLSLLKAGFPYSSVGTTIDFQCGSSLKAINLGASLVMSGQRDLIIVGGVESTSLEPKKQYNKKDPRYINSDIFYKRAQFSPFEIGDPDMIKGAENVSTLKNISKDEMDKWALKSHKRALYARDNNLLNDIISPIDINDRAIDYDQGIKNTINERLLKKVKPIYEGGNLTAGNSCLTHDGAALILLASENAVDKYNLNPIAEFISESNVGVDPNLSPLGPIASINSLLKKENLSIDDIDLFEINEAFAVKAIACMRELNIPENKLNILGGALAYGHPYGASGAIIMLHLIKALQITNKKLGIASLGVAGGLGISTLIKRC